MFTFSKPELFYRLGSALFLAFVFFSAIFCGQTRVNNLFNLAALLWVATLLTCPPLRHQLLANRQALVGGGLALIFLLYYSISALWGEMPSEMSSALTHSGYILAYLVWLFLSPSPTARSARCFSLALASCINRALSASASGATA